MGKLSCGEEAEKNATPPPPGLAGPAPSKRVTGSILATTLRPAGCSLLLGLLGKCDGQNTCVCRKASPRLIRGLHLAWQGGGPPGPLFPPAREWALHPLVALVWVCAPSGLTDEFSLHHPLPQIWERFFSEGSREPVYFNSQ